MINIKKSAHKIYEAHIVLFKVDEYGFYGKELVHFKMLLYTTVIKELLPDNWLYVLFGLFLHA